MAQFQQRRRADSSAKLAMVQSSLSSYTIEAFNSALQDLGPAPTASEIERDTPKSASLPSTSNPDLILDQQNVSYKSLLDSPIGDFMRAHGRDQKRTELCLELVRNGNWFHVSTNNKESKDGSKRTILVVNLGNITSSVVTTEEFVYCFILKVQQLAIKSSFDVLVDFSNFELKHEWPVGALDHMESTIGTLMALFFKDKSAAPTAYLLNFNIVAKEWSRRITRMLAKSRVVLMSSMSDFTAHFSTDLAGLEPQTILKLKCNSFTSEVVRLVEKVGVATVVQLSATHIAFKAVKKHDICGTYAFVIDYYPLENISSFEETQMGDVVRCTMHINSVPVQPADKSMTNLSIATTDSSVLVVKFQYVKASGLGDKLKVYISSLIPLHLIQTDEKTLTGIEITSQLIHVAFINMVKNDCGTRESAYILLGSLTKAFDLENIPLYPLIRGMLLPINVSDLVFRSSEKLSQMRPDLTIAFLKEALVFVEQGQWDNVQHIAEYIDPWISNLENMLLPVEGEEGRDTQIFIEGLLRDLATLCIQSERNFSNFKSIWETIGNFDRVTNLTCNVLQECLKQVSPGSLAAQLICDIYISVSYYNADLVGGIVAENLTAGLESVTAHSLNLDANWPMIVLNMCVMRCLSFNHDALDTIFPQLAHVLVAIFGLGSLFARQTALGVVKNMVQYLSISNSTANIEVNCRDIAGALDEELLQNSFGYEKEFTNFQSVSSPSSDMLIDPGVSSASQAAHIRFVELMAKLISLGDEDTKQTWTSEWISLSLKTSSKTSTGLRVPAFIALAFLFSDQYMGSFFATILNALIKLLENFDESERSVVNTIIFCINRISRGIPSENPILDALFWLGIGLVQHQSTKLVELGIIMIEDVLANIEKRNIFGMPFLANLLEKAEMWNIGKFEGLNFVSEFSLSLGMALLPALIDINLRERAVNVMVTYVDLLRCDSSSLDESDRQLYQNNMLGLAVCILPFQSNFVEVLALADLARDPPILNNDDALAYLAEKIGAHQSTRLYLKLCFLLGFLDLIRIEEKVEECCGQLSNTFRCLTAIARLHQAEFCEL